MNKPNGAEIMLGSILALFGALTVAQGVWADRFPGTYRGVQFFRTMAGRWVTAAAGVAIIGAGTWVILTNT